MESFASKSFHQLLRFPDAQETRQWIDTGASAIDWAESQIALLVKKMQALKVNLDAYTLTDDVVEASRFLEYIFDAHSRLMFKNPLMRDMKQFFGWLRLYGFETATGMVKSWIEEQNEYKYLVECLEAYLTWSPRATRSSFRWSTRGSIRVRYYGPVGTSGYARACRDIVKSLIDGPSKRTMDVSFVPLTIQNMNEDDRCYENILLSRWGAGRTVQAIHDRDFEAVDVVIIHSIPDMWIPVVKREKRINPDVITIGVTVWETDHVPLPWIPHLRFVDRVTFPNRWNRTVFRTDVPGLDTTYLPHPVTQGKSSLVRGSETTVDTLTQLQKLRQEIPDLYVFYTVNEFSGRKGLDLLLSTFIKEFSESDHVVLFIKTHGAVGENLARQLLDKYEAEHWRDRPPRVIMDYTRWSDDDIYLLHQEADCFVSLTKSEGQGLGACHAALLGKHVIMTQYGGQTDYLKNIDWVPYRVVPASFCSLFDPHHQICLDMPACRDFPFFIPTRHHWAAPDCDVAAVVMRDAFTRKSAGDPSTSEFLRSNFSINAVGAKFESFIRSTYSGKGHRVVGRPKPIPDVYAQPLDMFLPQRATLPEENLMETVLPGKKVRVTVIGCSGFGNFGDDLYADLHRLFLGKSFDVSICNTQTYVKKDGSLGWAHEYTTEDDLMALDYLVVGGGGLMNDDEVRSSIFSIYYPYCIAHDIPFSVISVGFGYRVIDGRAPQITKMVQDAFGELLTKASLITVRSISDRDTVLGLLPLSRHHRVHLLPDLGFGVSARYPNDMSPPASLIGRDYVVFCPTNFLSVNFPDVVHMIQKSLWDYPGSILVFLPLDGVQTPDEYPTRFVTEEMERVRNLFPDSILYQGRYYSGDFQKLITPDPPSDATVQSMETCAAIFRNARCIITGRYHGLVMAKHFGVPHEIGSASLVKLVEEVESPLDISKWQENYSLLEKDIVLQACAPLKERAILKTEPEDWDEDARNTTIVDIVTQTVGPPVYNSVPFVQSYSNAQLYRKKEQLLTEKYDIRQV